MGKLLFIEQLSNESALADKGVCEGDVILQINRIDVCSNSELSNELANNSERSITIYKTKENIVAEIPNVLGKLGVQIAEKEVQSEFEGEIIRQAARGKLRQSLLPAITSDTFPNKSISETLGLVRGTTVRSKHIGKDIMAGFKNIVGGEVRGYSELMTEARDEALQRMDLDAKLLGADAIVGVRFSTSLISVEMAEVTAYGTAIKLG